MSRKMRHYRRKPAPVKNYEVPRESTKTKDDALPSPIRAASVSLSGVKVWY